MPGSQQVSRGREQEEPRGAACLPACWGIRRWQAGRAEWRRWAEGHFHRPDPPPTFAHLPIPTSPPPRFLYGRREPGSQGGSRRRWELDSSPPSPSPPALCCCWHNVWDPSVRARFARAGVACEQPSCCSLSPSYSFLPSYGYLYRGGRQASLRATHAPHSHTSSHWFTA